MTSQNTHEAEREQRGSAGVRVLVKNPGRTEQGGYWAESVSEGANGSLPVACDSGRSPLTSRGFSLGEGKSARPFLVSGKCEGIPIAVDGRRPHALLLSHLKPGIVSGYYPAQGGRLVRDNSLIDDLPITKQREQNIISHANKIAGEITDDNQ